MGPLSGSGEERAKIGNRCANTSIRNRRRRSIRNNTGSSNCMRNRSGNGIPGGLALKWQDRRGRSRPLQWLRGVFSWYVFCV
jgi:hypothetical protein